MGNFLLPVEPLSFGTAETESLFSFYSRVAILHGYGSSQLLRALRAALESSDFAIGESRLYTGNGLNGCGLWVRKVADLLQRGLGRNDLDRLTLFAFPQHRPRSNESSRTSSKNLQRLRSWCEMCFREDAAREIDAHDRLLWTIGYIKRCPFHRVRLRTNCPSCHQPQRYHNIGLGLANCYSCSASLIGSDRLLQPDLLPHFGEQECTELVAAVAAGRISHIDSETVLRFYSALEKMQAPLHRFDRRKISRRAGSVPTLSNLVNIAVRHQVSIVQLASEPELAARGAFGLMLVNTTERTALEGRSREEVIDDVRSLMQRGLNAPNENRIPTLSEISKTFFLRNFSFQLHFPELARSYVSRVRRQGKLVLRRESGRGFIDRLASEGRLPYLTDGEVRSMLEDEFDFSPGTTRVLIGLCRHRRGQSLFSDR